MVKRTQSGFDDENPEWTTLRIANAMPFTSLPADVQIILLGAKASKFEGRSAGTGLMSW
jgi:hypothetical protein